MDALEYEKARIRMCRTMILKKGWCEACPLYNGLKRRCGLDAAIVENMDEDVIRKHIDIVIKWSKDHPIKTRQSKFLKMFPEVPMKDDVIDICPATVVEGLKNAEHCNHILCEDCKKTFWLIEVSE